jgi:hypothetical protein
MAGETVKFEKTDDNSGQREQSTIAFPYLDLDAAVEVAKAIYSRGGLGGCNFDELAAEMNQTVSGAFRLKVGAAKTFDLTEREGKSGVRLSELGQQIVSTETERAARAEAFLRVPLYSAVYEKYRGHLLPPMKALEREMQSLGVSSKQTDKARQAFERSAKQAGFFDAGDDRLVKPRAEMPGTKKTDEAATGGDEKKASDSAGRTGGGGSGGGRGGDTLHPFVRGLLDTLPAPETDWDENKRADWLRTAASIFKLIYKSNGNGTIEVTVTGAQGGG